MMFYFRFMNIIKLLCPLFDRKSKEFFELWAVEMFQFVHLKRGGIIVCLRKSVCTERLCKWVSLLEALLLFMAVLSLAFSYINIKTNHVFHIKIIQSFLWKARITQHDMRNNETDARKSVRMKDFICTNNSLIIS